MTIADACLIVSTTSGLASSATMIWISLGNRVKLHAIEHQTNHLTEQLVDSTRAASHAEGMAEGRAARDNEGSKDDDTT